MLEGFTFPKADPTVLLIPKDCFGWWAMHTHNTLRYDGEALGLETVQKWIEDKSLKKRCEQIELVSKKVKSEVTQLLSVFIFQCRHLHTLVLANNPIGDDGAESLACYLQIRKQDAACAVRFLDLSGTRLTADSVGHVASAFMGQWDAGEAAACCGFCIRNLSGRSLASTLPFMKRVLSKQLFSIRLLPPPWPFMQQRISLPIRTRDDPQAPPAQPSSPSDAFFNPEGGNCGNYNPAVPAASSVLSPMAAYFDGPASFFNSSGSGAMGSDGRQSQVGHDALPQAAPPTQEPHRASQTQRAPIMHAPMCMQPGMAAPFMLHPPQNMQSGVPVAPVSPGLQPPMCGMGPTLLQSRAPSQSQAKKKERDSEQKRSQGRAPCPIAVYVDLSSLRLRDKK
eukprot:s6791_g1.t1